jgi:malonyl-CoA/methylmalonyl-CoA synthetase
VRVVDEQGESLPAGETGDLQVRGSNVFQGYWRMPEKTREDFTEDGFFNTGDKATISADGYVAIVGRAKDLIICGGLNVYPKEVEQLLDDLEGVVESAVIGVPHADFGEAVVAVIVPTAGNSLDEQAIIDFCKGEIANFKVPKQVFFVDELPRNAMGKVQKNLLRERYGSGQ